MDGQDGEQMHTYFFKKYGLLICLLAISFTSQVSFAARVNINSDANSQLKGFVTKNIQGNYTAVETRSVAIGSAKDAFDLPWCPETPACPNINGVFTSNSIGGSSVPANKGYDCAIQSNGSLKCTLLTTQTSLATLQSDPTKYINIFCPELCTVTRQVTETSSSITAVKEAVCPIGYVQVGVFNAGDDIKYGNAPDAPYPIPSMEKYQELAVNDMYTCAYQSSQKRDLGCQYAYFEILDGIFYAYIVPYWDRADPVYQGRLDSGDATAKWVNANTAFTVPYLIEGQSGETGVGRYNSRGGDGCYWSYGDTGLGKNCNTSHTSDVCASVSCSGDNDDNSLRTRCKNNTAAGITFSTKAYYYYQFVKCTPRKGYYRTGKDTNTSAICGRKVPTFKKQ